jgi:hypothetical protein
VISVAERPNLAERAALEPECLIQLAVNVGHHGERDAEVLNVGIEPRWIAEGDDGDLSVTEFFETLAHGEHMLLARQSSKVSVQDQHERHVVLAVVVGRPGRFASACKLERW